MLVVKIGPFGLTRIGSGIISVIRLNMDRQFYDTSQLECVQKHAARIAGIRRARILEPCAEAVTIA
jgi:hypothetical protein